MTRHALDEGGEVSGIEVRAYRQGQLIHRELCESEEQAALAVEEWAEIDGVTCEVDDLSIRHRPEQILGPEPPDSWEDAYADQVEVEAARVDRYGD